MNKLIKQIASRFAYLPEKGHSCTAAWAVVLNNTTVGGQALHTHPKGKKIAQLVCDELGYKPEPKKFEGSLDDF